MPLPQSKPRKIAVHESLIWENDIWDRYLSSRKARIVVVSADVLTADEAAKRVGRYSDNKNFFGLRMNGAMPRDCDVYIFPADLFEDAKLLDAKFTSTSTIKIFVINDDSLEWIKEGHIEVETWGMIKTFIEGEKKKSDKPAKGKRPSDPQPDVPAEEHNSEPEEPPMSRGGVPYTPSPDDPF